MRILQVTPRYPPRTGGVETHVSELSRRLADRGHEVTVLTADAGPDVERRERRDGVTVRRHRGLAPGGAFHVAPGVLPAVRRSRADVVHAHNYHSLPLAFAALGAGDRRFVATPHYHGTSASPIRDRLLSLYRPVGGAALRRADAVVAVSDWERDRLRESFGVDAEVIPNGLDADRFRGADPRVRDRPYLLTVGRLTAYKGVQHAIRALPELPAYDLLVAGSGPYRDDLERIADDAGVGDRVEFLGFVPDDRLPGLYAGAAAFVTMSSFEAYGMTVAEALAAGTPCVVRRAGALADWCSERGVVCVDATTARAIGEAVTEAVSLGAVSASVPTWEEVCDRVERLYRA